MNIKDSLINFLYDKEYYISIYENNIYVFNYIDLVKLTDKLIILKLNKFNLSIIGSNLLIKKLAKNEILINGNICNIEFNY